MKKERYTDDKTKAKKNMQKRVSIQNGNSKNILFVFCDINPCASVTVSFDHTLSVGDFYKIKLSEIL